MRHGRASIARLRHGCSCQLLLSQPWTRTIAVSTTPRSLHQGPAEARGSRWITPHFCKGARGFASVEDEMKVMRVGYEEKKPDLKQDLERPARARRQHYDRAFTPTYDQTSEPEVGGRLPRKPDFLDFYAANHHPRYVDKRVPGERIDGTTPAIEMRSWIPQPIAEQKSSPYLARVMRAVQERDPISLSRAFIRWTNDLAIAVKYHNVAYRLNSNSDHQITFKGQSILREAQALPPSTMSEIFRMMDPVDNPTLDIAHGLLFTSGNTNHIDLNGVMTKFGIRSYHEAMHEAMLTMIAVRLICPETKIPGRGSLLPADLRVALRWAGLSSACQDASFIWSAMYEPSLRPYRSTSSDIWHEFLRARFTMDPPSYQFDRAKVITHPRHFNSADDFLPLDLLKILDRDRFVDNTFRNEPWHRTKNDIGTMFSKVSAQRHGRRSFPDHFRREKLYPHKMTQDLLCTAIIGFSRAGMINAVRDGLMWDYLGVQIYTDDNDDVVVVRGGRDFTASDELRPTEQLLNAIVAGLGSAGHLNLAIRLLDFLSKRYDIPIPRTAWSELLQWLYMHTAKRRQVIHDFINKRPTVRHARKKVGDVEMSYGRAMILEIFKLMTSEPYNIEPSLEDWEVVMKLYAAEGHVAGAKHSLEILRDKFVQRYDELVEEHKLAVADEVLWQTETDIPRDNKYSKDGKRKLPDHFPDPSPERLRLRLQLDHLYNTIAGRITFILKGKYRNDDPEAVQNFERTNIPNMILEFQRFLPRELHIQLHHGSMFLDRFMDERPFWKVEAAQLKERALLPVKASANQARWTQREGVEWTTADGAMIREFRSSPADRAVMSRGVGARMPWADVEGKWRDDGWRKSARRQWRTRHLRELYLAS